MAGVSEKCMSEQKEILEKEKEKILESEKGRISKFNQNAKKYPVEKCKGRADKYYSYLK
jgi:vacuolar-type H+-ATPase subunit H